MTGPRSSFRHPLVIGHRGAPGYRPEHSRSSYELAFALGADAVEPDIVASKDGVLVVRHENELSDTTDVDGHPEFADRRVTKIIDGVRLTGWFTEDFTWAELSTLRCRERLPAIRPASASFDGHDRILRLGELLDLVDAHGDDAGRPLGLVAEIKHATYFASIGLPLDELLAQELVEHGWNSGDGRLTIESFEKSVLGRIRRRGILANNIFLIEATGSPADLVAERGPDAQTYASFLTGDGLRMLRREVDGISVNKRLLLACDGAGDGERDGVVDNASPLVAEAHAAGLTVFCWTLRPENRFLVPSFRRGGDPAVWGEWESEFTAVLRAGVDGVFADHVDLAVTTRDTLYPREGASGCPSVGGDA